MTAFKLNDEVILTVGGQETEAKVVLAGHTGQSLMLEFDAVVLGLIGNMPVVQQPDGTWLSVMTGDTVTLESRHE